MGSGKVRGRSPPAGACGSCRVAGRLRTPATGSCDSGGVLGVGVGPVPEQRAFDGVFEGALGDLDVSCRFLPDVDLAGDGGGDQGGAVFGEDGRWQVRIWVADLRAKASRCSF